MRIKIILIKRTRIKKSKGMKGIRMKRIRTGNGREKKATLKGLFNKTK